MDTLVRCELAIKGACRIYWCLHYAEHPPQQSEEEDESKTCLVPTPCKTMKTAVKCKLITEH